LRQRGFRDTCTTGDRVVGVIVGVGAGDIAAILLRRWAAPLVARLAEGPLRPVLTAATRADSSAALLS
jgi:hypothetical protein